MATTTTRLSLRKPATTDTVNVETDLNDNYDTIDNEMGLEVRTDFPVSAYAGKLVMRSDEGNRVYAFTGSTWVELLVRDNIMAAQQQFDGTNVNTTSTSFITLSPEVSITFVAPPSGRVSVTLSGALEAESPSSAYLSWEMRETDSSGSIVHTATEDVKSVGQQNAFWHQGSTVSEAGGLTAGTTYFVRCMHKSSSVSSAATFFYRGLFVQPILN